MKNPMGMTGVKKWFGGMTAIDAGMALAGVSLTTAMPNYIVKDTTTTTGKAMKLAVAFGSAALSTMVANKISPTAAKFTAGACVASALLQTLSITAGINLGQPRGMRALPPVSRPISRVGESRYEYNTGAEPGVQVSVT